jgi:hypothetical protein
MLEIDVGQRSVGGRRRFEHENLAETKPDSAREEQSGRIGSDGVQTKTALYSGER